MRRMTLVFTGVVVVVVAALALSMISHGETDGKQAEQGVWGEPADGLSCSIRANKAVYAPGEDILLDVFLRNDNMMPVKVIRPVIHFSYSGDALPLQVSGPTGLCFYNGPFLEPPPPPSATAWTDLPAKEIIGASSTYSGPIRIVQKYWSMNPGEYVIRLKFERKDNECLQDGQKIPVAGAWTGEATSNTIRIRIAAE